MAAERVVRVFDAHCHLQDPRISQSMPGLLRSASLQGVRWFAVNGTSENDWQSVKKMGEDHNEVIPCFGLHPWYVEGRSSKWFDTLRSMFDAFPGAAIGEAGLDKGSRGKLINMATQVHVLKQQLALAKELHRPISLHCVRAFGELEETLREMGPFESGVILHSYLGSAEMVGPLAKQGAYFSFSGFLTSMKAEKARKMLLKVPKDRILVETDAPDALPESNLSELHWVPGDPEALPNLENAANSNSSYPQESSKKATKESSSIRLKALNHPANINVVLSYVATLLGMPREELAEITYTNTMRIFSYPGSKVVSGEGTHL